MLKIPNQLKKQQKHITFVYTIIVMTIEEVIQTKELPLSRKLSINLLLTASWATEVLHDALKPFELSLQQFNVLRILRGQNQEPANLSTINNRMVTKMSNTTRLIDKLITKGYVERTICPTNRRKVEIVITKEGLKILAEIDPIVTKAEENITANLKNNELEQLNNMLNNLRH